VSAEFRALASNESSPVTKWLRALARFAHGECGGPGVGAIGMCFTGNFALTMMLEPSMLAPVLSQPSLPLNNPAGIEIAPDEVKAVRERLEREDLTVLAYRFAGDKFCMAQRFAAYRARSATASSGGCFRTARRTPILRRSSSATSRPRTASSPRT
jgi:dienelactone hydrolase